MSSVCFNQELVGRYQIQGKTKRKSHIFDNYNKFVSSWRSGRYVSQLYISGQLNAPVGSSYPLGQGMWACTSANTFNISGDPFGTSARLFNGEWNTLVLGKIIIIIIANRRFISKTILGVQKFGDLSFLNYNIPPSGKVIYDVFDNSLFELGTFTNGTATNVSCYASLSSPCSKFSIFFLKSLD